MGLKDFFSKEVECVFCKAPNASKKLGGRIVCPNDSCPYYSSSKPVIAGSNHALDCNNNPRLTVSNNRELAAIYYRSFAAKPLIFVGLSESLERKKENFRFIFFVIFRFIICVINFIIVSLIVDILVIA